MVTKHGSGQTGSHTNRKSYAFQVTAAFTLVAAMTAVLMAGVVFILWNAGQGKLFNEGDLYSAMLIAAIISVLLAVMVGAYFASDLIAPIQRISKTAQAIKEGDYSARTELRGDDEIGQLCETFDDMADVLERDRELERQLIGDVAHELRTPLMAVQATVEAIQDGVFPADETRLSTISSETQRLSRLVGALLSLNRLENGTVVAKVVPMNLSDCLADLALNHQALIESAELSFDAQIDPEVRIRGDRDLISRAVANLFSNAVRYTPEGGSVTLVVTRDRGDACISVRDTGMGISQEDQSKVFSRFWRADAARNRSSGGLGVGLAMVKEVVDQHHGRVLLESELGVGSTFTIRIPLAPDDPVVVASMGKNDLRRLERAARKEAERLRKEQERLERQEREAAKRNAAKSARASRSEAKATGKGVTAQFKLPSINWKKKS